MQNSVMSWVEVLGGGALVGVAVGLIALALGAFLNEHKLAMRVFIACVLVGMIGGLKLLSITMGIGIWAIIQAYRQKKSKDAQPGVQADVP